MNNEGNSIRFIDLFCGIGGFRYGLEKACSKINLKSECVLSSDIDLNCQTSYENNFDHRPFGDISNISSDEVPDHDILLAGFPCQPFSIIGQMKGFEDTRGTLFFEIARILRAKKPRGFVLENVKLLKGHNSGETLKVILKTLRDLGYSVEYRVLNALDFGLPQKRERIWIVGNLDSAPIEWPVGGQKMTPLNKILEKSVDRKHYASDYIREKRWSVMQPGEDPTIWHENKSGNISAHPYSCALRAGASYNYLLVDGERRLTPREMLRLQGFPEKFKITCTDSQTRKQAGNSLPVSVADAVVGQLLKALGFGEFSYTTANENTIEMRLLEETTLK